MTHLVLNNLDTQRFIDTFLKSNIYDEDYIFNLNEDSIDYVHSFLKSIKHLILDLDEDGLIKCCLKTILNDSFDTNKTIIYLEDSELHCTTMNLSFEQYVYKEYKEIENVTIFPLTQNYCVVVPKNYFHGYYDIDCKNAESNKASMLFEIVKPHTATRTISYTQYSNDNIAELHHPTTTFEDNTRFEEIDCNDLPYLINTLLYKPMACKPIKLPVNTCCKISNFNKMKKKQVIDLINIHSYEGTKYMHIGYIESLYPIHDCNRIINTIVDKNIAIEDSLSIVQHLVYYVEDTLNTIRTFYELPEHFSFTNIHIKLIDQTEFAEFVKDDIDLFYIIIKITCKISKFRLSSGVTYNLKQGSVLFYPKNTSWENISEPCDKFIVAKVQ